MADEDQTEAPGPGSVDGDALAPAPAPDAEVSGGITLDIASTGDAEVGAAVSREIEAYFSKASIAAVPAPLPNNVIRRLHAAYPARSADIDVETKAFGAPFVQRDKGRILCVHQKYALRDGTILVLEVTEP